MPRRGFFNGYLLETSGPPFVQRASLAALPGLRFTGMLPGSQWEEFTLQSDQALMGEDTALTEKPYRYGVLARRSGARLLLVAESKDVVDYLLGLVRKSETFPGPLKKVRINVNALVTYLVAHPKPYTLCLAHADVPAYGEALRRCSFYGDDLGDTEWFKDSLSSVSVYMCGLRSIERAEETVLVGNYGSIGFRYRGARTVLEVQQALHFLRESGLLPDGDLPGE